MMLIRIEKHLKKFLPSEQDNEREREIHINGELLNFYCFNFGETSGE